VVQFDCHGRSIAGEKLDAVLAALNTGMSKAAVCRNFGVKRTTWLETLARLGDPHLTATSDVAAGRTASAAPTIRGF
jgi:transposase-like protein